MPGRSGSIHDSSSATWIRSSDPDPSRLSAAEWSSDSPTHTTRTRPTLNWRWVCAGRSIRRHPDRRCTGRPPGSHPGQSLTAGRCQALQASTAGWMMELKKPSSAERSHEIRGAPGDLVSLMPWGMPVTGVRTEGLRWPLCRRRFSIPERTRGISNEMLGGSRHCPGRNRARCSLFTAAGQ